MGGEREFGRGSTGGASLGLVGAAVFFDAEFCDNLLILSRWSCSVFAFCSLLGGVLSGLY